MKIRRAIVLIGMLVILVPIGMFVSEGVKIAVARSMGFTEGYVKPLARHIFSSGDNVNFPKFSKEYSSKEDYFNSKEYIKARIENDKGLFKIEVAGKLFVWGVSFISLFLYFKRRRKKKVTNYGDWLLLFLGLFFMRDVIIAAQGMVMFYPCSESVFWTQLFGEPFNSLATYMIFGIVLLGLIIYSVKGKDRWTFLISGFLGSLLGTYLWVFHLGALAFL